MPNSRQRPLSTWSSLPSRPAGFGDGVRYYYFQLSFQQSDGEGDPVSLILNLHGEVIDPEVTRFDSQKAYARHLYGKKGRP